MKTTTLLLVVLFLQFVCSLSQISDDSDDDDDETTTVDFWNSGRRGNSRVTLRNGPISGFYNGARGNNNDDYSTTDPTLDFDDMGALFGISETAPPPGSASCGEPVGVIGASVLYFKPGESPLPGTAVAIYTCNVGRKVANGDGIVFCLSSGNWSPLPQCNPIQTATTTTTTSRRPTIVTTTRRRPVNNYYTITLSNGPIVATMEPPVFRSAEPAAQQQTLCTNRDAIGTSDCDVVTKYRYNSDIAKCEGIAVCDTTPVSGISNNLFDGKATCLAKCSPSSSPVTTTTISTTAIRTTTTTSSSETATDSERKFGGTRGPKCLASVIDRTKHSSCLANTPYTLKTIEVTVSNVLEPLNLWRRFVTPKASGMRALEWDNDLAVTAERWAAQCSVGNDDASARVVSRIGGYIGQALCFGSGRQKSWKDCVNEWAAQSSNWAYGVGAKNGDTETIKDYVQIIWGQARYVGCGVASCVNTRYDYTMVCNFGPGGPLGATGMANPYATPYTKANS